MNSQNPVQENELSEANRLSVINKAITNGSIKYICGCESRIYGFVRKHYSFRGALQIHRHALGWDIIRVPVNIAWSVVRMLLALVGFLARMLGLRKFHGWIKRIPPGLETSMDRQISWLIVTELLKLPHEDSTRHFEQDALMEEIVKDPQLQCLLNEELDAFDGLSKNPGFRRELDGKLAEYGASRTGSADLVSNAALLISSKVALGQASFGTLSAGTAVSASVAHSIAVSNFWLGSTIGSYYYTYVPVAVSMSLHIAMTVAVAIILALVSTFIGILTDPIQAKLGLHQKRLKKLVHSIRDDLHGSGDSNFALREKYIGRIFDVMDLISTVGRSM